MHARRIALAVLCLAAVACKKGEHPSPSSAPITALVPNTWTWVEFPESQCGHGKSTGLALNLSPASKKLLILLLGGGACYDARSCASKCDPEVGGLCSMHLDGFTESMFHEQLLRLQPGTLFDREGESNPFKSYSWVVVPYCTGDFHAGTVTAAYGVHHVGMKNLEMFLARIVPTFPLIDRVVLAGVSAGGFGAVFNYERVKAAFGAVRVDLIDDSGPPMSPKDMPIQTILFEAWGAASLLPPDCKDCKEGWDRFLPYLSNKYPQSRFSVLSSFHDPTIGPLFAGPIASPQGYERAIKGFADALAELPNVRVFLADETHHVYLKDPLPKKASMGVTLAFFLSAQVEDRDWKSVRP